MHDVEDVVKQYMLSGCRVASATLHTATYRFCEALQDEGSAGPIPNITKHNQVTPETSLCCNQQHAASVFAMLCTQCPCLQMLKLEERYDRLSAEAKTKLERTYKSWKALWDGWEDNGTSAPLMAAHAVSQCAETNALCGATRKLADCQHLSKVRRVIIEWCCTHQMDGVLHHKRFCGICEAEFVPRAKSLMRQLIWQKVCEQANAS